MTERQFRATLANCRKVAQKPVFQSEEARRLLREAARQARLAQRAEAALERILPAEQVARVRAAAPAPGQLELLTSDRAVSDALRADLRTIRAKLMRSVPGVRHVSVAFEPPEQRAYDDPD